MERRKLLDIFNGLKVRVNDSKELPEKRKNFLLNEIASLQTEYNHLEIKDEKIYNAVVRKGEEVLLGVRKGITKANFDNVKTFIRYATAAIYDFKGDLRGLTYLVRVYMLTAILFMALSPQFFGFIMPAVFIIPIYMGLKGMKARGRHGFTMAMSLVPVALLTASVWVRYALYAFPNFNKVALETAQELNRSIGTAKALILVPSILGFVLFVATLLTAYLGYKVRKVFV